MDIYDAVTGVLQQSLSAPEIVTKIQASPDGFTLFFSHSTSVTMWDVQTGGLIHTFTMQFGINDTAVSTTGDRIACGLSNGSVAFWNIRTKEGGRGNGNGQPVVTICWLSPMELAVATWNSVYILEVPSSITSNTISIPGHIWGMVCLHDKLLVGCSPPDTGTLGQKVEIILHRHPTQNVFHERQSAMRLGQLVLQERQSAMHHRQLTHPVIVGNEIVCITPTSGVQLFSTKSHSWTNNPPLLGAATSVTISLNRNLVVQTKDSIQIFSIGVLEDHKDRNDIHTSGIYPLGENHVLCFQSTGHVALLKSETMQELSPDDISPFQPLAEDQAPSTPVPRSSEPIHELLISLLRRRDLSLAMDAWRSGTPLAREELTGYDLPMIGLSPEHAMIVTVDRVPEGDILVEDTKHGTALAQLPQRDGEPRMVDVYGLTFDSETRFNLKIDGPEGHVQIPYDIIASPSGSTPYTIIKGEPVPLSEPRAIPPYTLDANCEWVLDAKSRKICWISPSNLRRGSGGHFWVGRSLVMVGDDGVVRRVIFKEPDF